MIRIVPVMTVWVEMYDLRGDLLLTFKDQDVSYTETITLDMLDKYKKLIGDGNARVNTSLSMKVGGENYSSISVGASCTFGVDQSAEKIALAQEMSHDACLGFVHEKIVDCSRILDQLVEERSAE